VSGRHAGPGTGDASAVRVVHDGPVTRLLLDRAARRNALDEALIAELTAAVEAEGTRPATRVIVLGGEGPAFCAGADLAHMRAIAERGHAENLAEAHRLARLFSTVRDCPKPTVARVHGAALGGGAGLVAACDLAVAADDTVFGFTEARLGIVPAVIAPFVVSRIGWSAARELFLTGERFGAERAREVGLVGRVVPPAQLDAVVDERTTELLRAGPEAQAAVKRLVQRLAGWDPAVTDYTAALIAELRASPEGREGLSAFLERRPPAWAPRATRGGGS
jgi:methylglutaconyl-CoA hydratase